MFMFLLMVKILELIRYYKLVLIFIGYVVNTLVNEGKMVREEEKHGLLLKRIRR
jgi:hypothetical protein